MLAVLNEILVPSIVLVAYLAILHASFQLGTSVLTLMSGHSLMHKTAKRRLLTLNIAYIFGVFSMTTIMLAGMTAAFVVWLPLEYIQTAWLFLTSAAIVVGLLVMIAYYRDGKGTRLWIPRSFASYLENRSKKTRNAIEAGALGITSVVAELPFTAVLMAIASLALASTVMIEDYLIIIILYCLVATLPLMAITLLLSGNHKLSRIQHWRESNKTFLQYSSGIGIIIAGLFIWVNFILLGNAL